MDPKTTTPFKTPDALEERAGTLEDIVRATLNILDDFNLERSRFEEMQRATFNILEDFDGEKQRLEEMQRGTLNILDDFDAEKSVLGNMQRASLNILEDFNSEKAALEDAQRATLNVLEDFEAEKAKVEAVNNALNREIAERKQAEERIKKLNEELEGHTAQLASANKELEAFSYSVSHDLRAPLRGIDGFSQALLEDYGPKLDERAKDYLLRVRSATQRMAQLIDDMLTLSRVTRSEMHRVDVDLSAIVYSLAEELKKSDEQRAVEFVIQPGLRERADRALMQVVLQNLIDNAWKFTSK